MLWGQTVCRIWLPDRDEVAQVPRSALRPLGEGLAPELERHRIGYVAAAAKVAEALAGRHHAGDPHVLLAPMESNVIPLPHQLNVLARTLAGDRVRYMLADEVGLGKTIEAGLVMRELKLRGRVRRTLVVAPKGLATQWVAEMETHFNEPFRLVLGEDIGTLQRLALAGEQHRSPWTLFDQVIVSLDSVKPMEKRRGWSAERVDAYNRSRFEDLISAEWDLVIVDEAHRLGGSTDQVARYKLGQGLAEAAPYILLLSATPHQGKTDAFHRLVNLLDPETFPDEESVSRQRVAPYVIRTEKRKAVDALGMPLFKPRRTQMIPVSWLARHDAQQMLYEEVTDYVREGYNQAMREKKYHMGFLMVLMQRLVISSTQAIKTTLRRRLDALNGGLEDAGTKMEEVGALYDMDGQELLDELLSAHLSALHSEGGQVAALLERADQCEALGPDAKAETLLDWIYQLQADENDVDLKVLVFTEFLPTQAMLKEFLEARGISVATLNGTMSMDERKRAQDAFRDEMRILVSTDAGGEGLNLQFCHVVINYDIPWNPMRLEQRIGRVDRIGQSKAVRAINLVFEESVEYRVREVLEEKLAVIFKEFGIDKTGDVLDSALAGELFEEVFTHAYMDPDNVEATVDQGLARLRSEVQVMRESAVLLGLSEEPDVRVAERLRTHPLPHWVERMTVGYLLSHGGSATRRRSWWDLAWPDKEMERKCVFNAREAERLTDAHLINLEDDRVRSLTANLPELVPGQALPLVQIPDLLASVRGDWGLFEIRLVTLGTETGQSRLPVVRRAYLPVFVSEEGKRFLPTARHIWDALQTTDAQVLSMVSGDEAQAIHDRLSAAAEEAGLALFESLQQEQMAAIAEEEARGEAALTARRRAIERVGLPEVRHYRLTQLAGEEADWRGELAAARQTLPGIRPLLFLQIK